MVLVNVAGGGADPLGMRMVGKNDVMEHILGVVMAQQFSVKKRLKKFGDEGAEVVTKELLQLHDMQTWKPRGAKQLTKK